MRGRIAGQTTQVASRTTNCNLIPLVVLQPLQQGKQHIAKASNKRSVCCILFHSSFSHSIRLSCSTNTMATCKAVCVVYSNNSIVGTLTLTSSEGSTSITGTLSGLTPGKHGLSICVAGDLSQGGNSCGPIFNPFGAYCRSKHTHSHTRVYHSHTLILFSLFSTQLIRRQDTRRSDGRESHGG